MNTQQLEQNNINNLRNLFKTMGSSSFSREEEKSFNISNSWPGRLWGAYDYTLRDTMVLINKALSESSPYTISLWDKKDESTSLSTKAMEDNGFAVSFEQIAMVLDLKDYVIEDEKNNLQMKYVSSIEDINAWVEIASSSFSHQINEDVIQNISKDENVELLLAYIDGIAVGTALIFSHSDVAGIHLVGVPLENRGQGIAKSIMLETINFAQKKQIPFMTLQASALGMGIYKRLGFKEQFVLKNYMKKQ